MKLVAKSIKGTTRKINQDTICIDDRKVQTFSEEIESQNSTLVLQVCDGMGGYKNGDKASQFVGKTFFKEFFLFDEINSKNLKEILIRCHNSLFDLSLSLHGFICMGTTLASAIIKKDEIWIVNVGDTQIYSSKNSKFNLESQTHIVDQENPSVLSQCIGGNGKGRLKPFIKKFYKKDFDQLLILSDGIHLHRSEWLNKIDFKNISSSLFDDALKNGSTDDMSFIYLEL